MAKTSEKAVAAAERPAPQGAAAPSHGDKQDFNVRCRQATEGREKRFESISLANLRSRCCRRSAS